MNEQPHGAQGSRGSCVSFLPLVSIVTPSFNQGCYIEQTIQSVLAQDYPNIEYIVMDGGSSDNTLDILRKYETHLVWTSERDRGQSHAINKGWQRSSGQILTWLNSDDYYAPGAIRTIVEQFVAHPDAAVVYGDVVYVDADGVFLRKALVEASLLPNILVTNVVGQPNAFVARWAVEQIGPINEDLHYVMDWDLWLRMVHLPFVYVPELIAHARIHEGTKTFGQADRHLAECVRFLEDYYRGAPTWALPFRNRAVAYWYAALGSYWVQSGQFRRALGCFRRAIIRDRRYIRNRGILMAFAWGLLGDRLAVKIRSLRSVSKNASRPQDPFQSNPFANVFSGLSL
ncbi:MAG: glycosyltransferase family 2 protein [Chloroflexi bacterium]|nr:glycosyltransferase family 2 protein [Chloroflexota bacterium]